MRRIAAVLVSTLALLAFADTGVPLVEVPHPDLGAAEVLVREQLQEERHTLEALLAREDAAAGELAAAFGSLGRSYHAYSLTEPATACYRNAGRLAPKDFRWSYLLGALQQREGDLEEARASLERALLLRPRDLPALLHLAAVEVDRGALDRAAARALGALAVDSASAAAHHILARVAVARDDFEEAARRFERTLELQPAATRVHYSLALAYRRLGRIDDARRHLALRGDTTVGFPDPLLGELAEALTGSAALIQQSVRADVAGFVEESIAINRRAVAVAPESAEARRDLGAVLAQAGETEEAVEQYRETVRLEPERALNHYSLALLLDEAGAAAEALPHFARAVEIEPGYRLFRSTLAARLATAGRYEEAREHFDHLLAGEPEDHEARLGRARVRVELGALEEAAADARAILEARSALPRARAVAHHVLGVVLARGGSKEEARRHLKEAVALDSDLVDAHFLLASLAGQARLFDEAAAHFARVVELDPQRASARLAEATALALGGREGEAVERLVEGREALPQDPAIAHALARLYVTAADPALRDGARALDLAQALFEFQQSFEHAETLAMALAEVGRFAEAARLQRSLVEQVPPNAPAELAVRLRENLERYERGATQ